jgi:hypothetical protein
MKNRFAAPMALLVGAGILAACSSDGALVGSNVTTSSVQTPAPVAVAPKVDPACLALAAKIDTLRRDGVTERIEKASVGKSTNVSIKRSSLALMTELDRANAEFQSKCTPLGPKPATSAGLTTMPISGAGVGTTGTATSSSTAVVAPVVSEATPKQ